MLAADPTNDNKLCNVALTEKNLGSYFAEPGDVENALVHYLRAYELDQKRVEARPGRPKSTWRSILEAWVLRTRDGGATTRRSTRIGEASRFGNACRRRTRRTYARSREAFMNSELARVYLAAVRVGEAGEHAERAVALDQMLQGAGEA